MARQQIDIGVQGNDGTGDSIRAAFDKVNQNFTQLFAVFGLSGTIKFTNLDDAPSSYGADQVIVSNADATALLAKNLVGGTGIQVDHSDTNEIRIISTGGKIANDIKPSLGNHLNGQGFTIGNLADPSDDVAIAFNAVHDTSLTADNLVLSRGYADKRYLQSNGQTGAGVQLRVREEPLDTNAYTVVIDGWPDGYAYIPSHGYNTGSNGIAFKYQASIAPATGLISGTTYYLKYIDKDRLGVFASRTDAVNGVNRIVVNDPPVATRGTEVFVDAYYDSTLAGNWLSNEALPRMSVVRRQGDTMEGVLKLSDHPGSLAGQGSPNGPDDLQAATKFYVDNSSFASQANLFVAVSGDDEQKNTPAGKEGRAFAYAYATLNAACRKAEEIINNARVEPGPYRQLLAYSSYTNLAYLNSIVTGTGAARTLKVYTNGVGVDQSKNVANRDLREGSILRGIHSGATARVVSYDGVVSLDDVYQTELLHYRTDKVYFQSNYVNSSTTLALNRAFVANEVVEYVKAKYPSIDLSFETKCRRDAGLIVDAICFDILYGGNIQSIDAGRAYWNGVTSVLPTEQRAPTIDAISYINLLAQDIINNTTIPTAVGIGYGKRGTIVQKTGVAGEANSGALITRLINEINDIISNGVNGSGSFLEFLPGEQLEFGQPVPETHVTIRVESGIYYEQYPIRVPTNVSIKGDEFRRVIIRPAPGVSTSVWAGLYFYRDDEFDGLTRTFTSNTGAASSSGTTITLATGNTSGLEIGMHMAVTAGTGLFDINTYVTEFINSTSFKINKAPLTPLVGATVRGLNNSNLAPTGQNFGYHYLTDPTGITGVFNTVPLAGNTVAAGLITAAKSSIQTNVINYINSTYPGFVYDQTLCRRDIGYIIDAVVYDITYGGVTRSLAAAQAYRTNASGILAISTQLEQTLAGITRANTAMQQALAGGSPEVNAAGYVGSLIDGIKASIIGVNNPPKNNKDMDVFLLNDGGILRNITCQGHGGFMCVLDPEGQIQTKSPYFQTATSLSGSTNTKRFAGGMFIDGFAGNLPAKITSRITSNTITVSGLYVRAPGIPTAFVVGPSSYQVNAVTNYNRSAGTATITLDASTPFPTTNPITSLPWVYPYDIVFQTPGNKSMLGNDFTQVNDLGYGIVTTNNGLSEAVSVFTYYCYVGYLANNGGQIRSVAGSTCYGTYGLKASGSDPTEVADQVSNADNTVQVAKIYKRGAYASKNVAGDAFIYIDNYDYIPYNISEIEIDHSATKSSIVDNTGLLPNNITIAGAGLGYAVDDFVEVDGGTLYPGGLKTKIRITEIGAGGAVTKFEVIEAGTYSVSPVGAWPTISGLVTTTRTTGAGAGLTLNATFLGSISSYEISNIEKTTIVGAGVDPGGAVGTRTVIKCNLNTQAGAGSASTLVSPLVDGQTVIIRLLQNFRFTQIEQVKPTRPSTAVEFTTASESGTIYRTLAYSRSYPDGSTLPASQAVLSFDNSFNYAILQTNPGKLSDSAYSGVGGTTMGATAGDVAIAVQTINSVATIARLNSGDLITAWAGRLHHIVSYVAASGSDSAYIVLSDYAYGSGTIVNNPTSGIARAFPTVQAINIRGGIKSGLAAAITVRISTCRATGHDFLDVGTGGFNDSNYPNNVFGGPVGTASFGNAVVEDGSGRVFHASTDQNGIFRVGKFFAVDQGTGTVTFAASIALTNLDGIGFKRGIVVKEFSAEPTFTNNADDTVPVQSAIRSYIDSRLGYDHNGNVVAAINRIPGVSPSFPAGGGFVPIFGSPTIEADLSMGSTTPHRITNLTFDVNSPTDATTVGYVDGQVALRDSLYKLKEVLLMAPAKSDLALFTGAGRTMVSSTVAGDITGTFSSSNLSTLVGGITTPPTIDSGISGTGQNSITGGVVIADISGWPVSGYFQIDNEIFVYTSITPASNRFDGVTRAQVQTSGAVHSAGATVYGLNGSTLNLQLNSGVVTNTEVAATAAIEQSKLSMTIATTRASAPTGTAEQKQAASGLASFDTANFEITDGFVGIKEGGIALTEIQTIAAGSILGNLTGSADHPQEVTTTGIVNNGVNSLFNSYDSGGGNVLVRRSLSLKTTTTFTNLLGTAVSGSGTTANVPVSSVASSGTGAIVNVDRSGGAYTGIYVQYGGQNYAEGDQLYIPGNLLGGTSPANDLQFTVVNAGGTNIDTTVYLGLERISIQAAANSLVKTDYLGNLGNDANRFNAVYATTFSGNATSATTATNIAGGARGAIPYQSGAGTTSLLAAGTSGKFLKAMGAGADPIWADLPTGGQGAFSDLSLTGHLAVSVNGAVTSAGTDQATATVIDKDINVITVTSPGTGIRLPVAVAGYRIIIRNSGFDTINVYPGVGANINAGAANDPVQLDPSTSLEYFCTVSASAGVGGEWFNLNATFA